MPGCNLEPVKPHERFPDTILFVGRQIEELGIAKGSNMSFELRRVLVAEGVEGGNGVAFGKVLFPRPHSANLNPNRLLRQDYHCPALGLDGEKFLVLFEPKFLYRVMVE